MTNKRHPNKALHCATLGLCYFFMISAIFGASLGNAQSTSVTPQHSANPPPQPHPVLLILGDSLSASYRISEQKGWVAILQQRLQSEGFNIRVVNASVSGATTAAGLQQLPRALKAHEPTWVVIALGGNDGLQGKPIPYIKRNLGKLIEKSVAAEARVILLGIRLPPNYGSAYTEPFFNMFAELSQQHKTAYLPFMLKDVMVEVLSNKKEDFMMEDGIHPTAAAQPIILNTVWKTLKPELIKQHTP